MSVAIPNNNATYDNKITLQKIAAHNPPAPGTIWEHYKGGKFRVTGCVISARSEDLGICYVSIDDPLPYSWVLSIQEWESMVDYAGMFIRRFRQVE